MVLLQWIYVKSIWNAAIWSYLFVFFLVLFLHFILGERRNSYSLNTKKGFMNVYIKQVVKEDWLGLMWYAAKSLGADLYFMPWESWCLHTVFCEDLQDCLSCHLCFQTWTGDACHHWRWKCRWWSQTSGMYSALFYWINIYNW